MAHKKSGKAVRKQGPSPRGKRLGVKVWGGEKVKPGMVIVRQRGTKFHPGEGVKMGRDFTIFATCEGKVVFAKKYGKTFVSVR